MKSIFKDTEFNEVRGVGGGSKSRIWDQIKADVLNLPYIRLNREEFAVLGLAVIGGYAVKLFKNLAEPVTEWVKPIERIIPIIAHHETYKQYAEFYTELIEAADKIFEKCPR